MIPAQCQVMSGGKHSVKPDSGKKPDSDYNSKSAKEYGKKKCALSQTNQCVSTPLGMPIALPLKFKCQNPVPVTANHYLSFMPGEFGIILNFSI